MFEALKRLFTRGPTDRDAALWGPWLLELDGEPVVRLSGARVPDQFWVEFDAGLIEEAATPAVLARLADEATWVTDALVMRSMVTGRAAEGILFALESGRRFTTERIVGVRGL